MRIQKLPHNLKFPALKKQQLINSYKRFNIIKNYCQHEQYQPRGLFQKNSIRNIYISTLSSFNAALPNRSSQHNHLSIHQHKKSLQNQPSSNRHHKNSRIQNDYKKIYKQIYQKNLEVNCQIKILNLKNYDLKNDIKIGNTIQENFKLNHDVVFCQDMNRSDPSDQVLELPILDACLVGKFNSVTKEKISQPIVRKYKIVTNGKLGIILQPRCLISRFNYVSDDILHVDISLKNLQLSLINVKAPSENLDEFYRGGCNRRIDLLFILFCVAAGVNYPLLRRHKS